MQKNTIALALLLSLALTGCKEEEGEQAESKSSRESSSIVAIKKAVVDETGETFEQYVNRFACQDNSRKWAIEDISKKEYIEETVVKFTCLLDPKKANKAALAELKREINEEVLPVFIAALDKTSVDNFPELADKFEVFAEKNGIAQAYLAGMGFDEYEGQLERLEQLAPELVVELKLPLSKLTPQQLEAIVAALAEELMKRHLEKGTFALPEIAEGDMTLTIAKKPKPNKNIIYEYELSANAKQQNGKAFPEGFTGQYFVLPKNK